MQYIKNTVKKSSTITLYLSGFGNLTIKGVEYIMSNFTQTIDTYFDNCLASTLKKNKL